MPGRTVPLLVLSYLRFVPQHTVKQRTTNLDFSVVIQSPIEADGGAPIEQFMPQRDAGFLVNIAQSRKISLKSNGRNIKTRIPRVSMRSGPSPWGENSGHLGWKRCCDNVRLSKVRKLAVREKLEARRRLGRFALTALFQICRSSL